MRKLCISLPLLLFLTGCASASVLSATKQPSVASTQPFNSFTATIVVEESLLTERVGTVMALQTASATPFPTRLPTNTPTLEPTLPPLPMPENPILISRTNYSGDGVDEFTSCLRSLDTYDFVLYQNGRLIISDGKYQETILSQETIDKLMSEIEATGIYSLTGDDDQYVENAPTPLPGGWSWGSRITVKGTSISLRGDISPSYEVDAVQKTKLLIYNLETPALKPYNPDSVRTYVVVIDNPSFDIYDPQPSRPLLHWSRENLQLDSLAAEFVNILSGDPLHFLMEQIQAIPSLRMVEQEGNYYLVAACPYFEP